MMNIPPHITREVYREAYLAERQRYYLASPDMAGGKVKAAYRRIMIRSRHIWAGAVAEMNKPKKTA